MSNYKFKQFKFLETFQKNPTITTVSKRKTNASNKPQLKYKLQKGKSLARKIVSKVKTSPLSPLNTEILPNQKGTSGWLRSLKKGKRRNLGVVRNFERIFSPKGRLPFLGLNSDLNRTEVSSRKNRFWYVFQMDSF